jgi:membrane fusion protein, multidrug efflux system
MNARRAPHRPINGRGPRGSKHAITSMVARSTASAAILILVACSKHPAPPPPPTAVNVVKVESQTVDLTKDLVGRLAPYLSANVTARVAGVLIKRDYAEGADVKAGQVLFEIDPTYYQAQLNSALGVLGEDEAAYENDKLNAGRYHQLLPVGSVSQQTVDTTDAAVRTDEAKIKADKAQVEVARINLNYTKVTSPISGVASQQQYTVGALVGASTADVGSGGTLLTTVNQIDPVYVNFTMSAADLLTLRNANEHGKVSLAQQAKTTVQVMLPDGALYGDPGVLDFSDVNVNATTGAVNLRAQAPNKRRVLLPGMFVTLRVTLGQQHDVFLIPQTALLRDTVGAYVLTADSNGKVVRKDVTAIDSAGNSAIVTRGLVAGDQVIVNNLQSVKDGGQVKATVTAATVPPAHGSDPAPSGTASGNNPAGSGQ